MAEMGILSGIALPAMISLLPWLAGVFVVVLGFGLLSRGRSDTRREREAADRSRSRPRSTSSKRASSERSSTETSDASEEAASASTFEMPESLKSDTSWNPFGKKRIPLRRSMSDKRIMGVCSGIAHYFNIDPTLVRIAFVIGVIVTGGPFILAYIGLGWAMPKDTELSHEERMRIIRES
jgi:phage shock protein C